jgi:prolyl-tRNA synthetase
MNLEYLDASNQLHPVVMGSYGIGPGRCLAALAEQNHDEYGVKWPMAVAPFEVAIVIINLKVEKQVQIGNELYDVFKNAGIDVVLDDRDERAGVKFNDMDLLGVPLRITVGKTVDQDMVELKVRGEKDSKLIPISDALTQVQSMIKEQLSK